MRGRDGGTRRHTDTIPSLDTGLGTVLNADRKHIEHALEHGPESTQVSRRLNTQTRVGKQRDDEKERQWDLSRHIGTRLRVPEVMGDEGRGGGGVPQKEKQTTVRSSQRTQAAKEAAIGCGLGTTRHRVWSLGPGEDKLTVTGNRVLGHAAAGGPAQLGVPNEVARLWGGRARTIHTNASTNTHTHA